MIGLLSLRITETDSFCNNINTLKSTVLAIEKDREVYIKSLISLLTLDLSKEITVEIISCDEKELKRFREIIELYGGKIIENY